MRVTDVPEICRLSTAEKILFVEDLWDTISSDAQSVPVPEGHRAELDRRLRAYEKCPGELLSLDELQAGIETRK